MNKTSIALALLLAAAPLGAQVGYTPETSPFRDLEYKQEFSLYSGYFRAGRDPAGVAPQSGPLLGARYEVRIGGPAEFSAKVARVFSQRTVIDPTKSVATRTLRTENWPLYLTDLGIAVNLTGQKSLHEIVPVVDLGIGLASDFKKADVGGYKFGTSFAFSFGTGVRWVPGGNFQLRGDIADYLYQIQYPSSYGTTNGTIPAVLATGQAQNLWKHNLALTVGASYLFFR